MAFYKNNSPWSKTAQVDGVLDIFKPRYITADADDQLYQVDPYYNLRPDLLAYDLYEDPKLWWVFAMRNPNIIRDPIFDLYTGQIIIVTSPAALKKILGT
jgi:hypothetical protein